MKICFIGKYPPIQGGVSAQSFWMCRMLADRGHEIEVVTNAPEVEADYRCQLLAGDVEQLAYRSAAGGHVSLSGTTPWPGWRFHHVPDGNPTVSRLTSLAVEVIRRQSSDVILGWYLQPYGVAAALASAWTSVPYAVRHAGSDRFTLMAHPELRTALGEVLRQAEAVIDTGTSLAGIGVPSRRIVAGPPSVRPPLFSPKAEPMAINAVIDELLASSCGEVVAPGPLRADRPVVGTYGKVGTMKGSFDLLREVEQLREEGVDVQLVVLGGGAMWTDVSAEVDRRGLTDSVWRLPFLAPWHVPKFIKACSMVCFLERSFAIRSHTSGVPAEVLACGVPLISSEEGTATQSWGTKLSNGTTHLQVADPTTPGAVASAIRRIIEDSGLRRRLSINGPEAIGTFDGAAGESYERALQLAARGAVGETTPDQVSSILCSRCPALTELLDDLPQRVDSVVSNYPDNGPAVAAYRVASAALSTVVDSSASTGQLAEIEVNYLWLDIDIEGIEGIPLFPSPAHIVEAPPSIAADDLRPVAGRGYRAGRYSVDVSGHVESLRSDEPRAHAAPSQPIRTYLFCKKTSLGGAIHVVEDWAVDALTLADGLRPIVDIADAVGRSREDVLALLSLLDEYGFIGWTRGTMAANRPDL